jgi:hypothetical protein
LCPAENQQRFQYKNQSLEYVWGKSVYFGNQAERMNILCGQKVKLFNVETEGARSKLGVNG